MISSLRALAYATVVALSFLAGPVAGQAPSPLPHAGSHEGHANSSHGSGSDTHVQHEAVIKGVRSAAAQAFVEANARMHAGMDIVFSGDADVDFVKGMIAHHQGAIDMARIVLEHGKDPEIRKLANDIIKAQEAEISMMQDWLRRRGN